MGIAFQIFAALPGEDLIDLRQNELSPFAIEFWQHRRIANTQARQANQASLLLAGGSVGLRPAAVYSGRAQRRGNCCMGSGESGCHYAAETALPRFGESCHGPIG